MRNRNSITTFFLLVALTVSAKIASKCIPQPLTNQNQLLVSQKVTDSELNTDINFKSITIVSTPAFLRLPNGGEARMARLEFHGGVCKESCEIEINFNGHNVSNRIDCSAAPVNEIELALPGEDIMKPTQLFVSLKCNRNNFTASKIINPTRKWNVYLTPHSHVSAGYTD